MIKKSELCQKLCSAMMLPLIDFIFDGFRIEDVISILKHSAPIALQEFIDQLDYGATQRWTQKLEALSEG